MGATTGGGKTAPSSGRPKIEPYPAVRRSELVETRRARVSLIWRSRNSRSRADPALEAGGGAQSQVGVNSRRMSWELLPAGENSQRQGGVRQEERPDVVTKPEIDEEAEKRLHGRREEQHPRATTALGEGGRDPCVEPGVPRNARRRRWAPRGCSTGGLVPDPGEGRGVQRGARPFHKVN